MRRSKQFQHKKKKNGANRKIIERQKPIHVRAPLNVHGAPDSMRVTLQYSTQYLLYQSGSLEARYVTNGLWDVDPLVGGRTVPYFNEWMSIYAFYKVLNYSVRIQGCNLEFLPMSLLCGHTNTDPSTTGVGARDISDGPYGRKYMMGSANGNNISPVIRMTHSVRQIVGDKLATTSERYVGSSSANPIDLTYFVVGVTSPIGSVTNGVIVDVTISYDTVFFDRKRVEPNATFELLQKTKKQDLSKAARDEHIRSLTERLNKVSLQN